MFQKFIHDLEVYGVKNCNRILHSLFLFFYYFSCSFYLFFHQIFRSSMNFYNILKFWPQICIQRKQKLSWNLILWKPSHFGPTSVILDYTVKGLNLPDDFLSMARRKKMSSWYSSSSSEMHEDSTWWKKNIGWIYVG